MLKMNFWESPNKMVKKEILRKADFSKKPTELSICTIYVSKPKLLELSIKEIKENFHSDIVDENSKKVIVIGEACSRVDKYIERAIQTMSLSEHSIITVKIPLDDSKINYNVLSIEITLEAVEFYKPIWEWSQIEKYTTALKYKEKGVELFKDKRFKDAFHRFSKACKLLITLEPQDETESAINDIYNLRYILYNNMAECHLIKKNYELVLILCQKVLNKDANNVKALYRSGVAYGNLKDYEKAVNNLKLAISLDPTNTKVQEKFNIYNEHWRNSVQGYQDMVRKMFKTL